jgi:hypothetical protein
MVGMTTPAPPPPDRALEATVAGRRENSRRTSYWCAICGSTGGQPRLVEPGRQLQDRPCTVCGAPLTLEPDLKGILGSAGSDG